MSAPGPMSADTHIIWFYSALRDPWSKT
jgi:hypothetical protein